MRLAYFSPLPPQRSGIADYSAELLPSLSRHAEIDVFTDARSASGADLPPHVRLFDYRDFEALRRERAYDTPLYQMGNNAIHEPIYNALRRFPGVTVLHDYVLHHFLVEVTLARGDRSAYVREMGYCHGLAGTDAAWRALCGDRQIQYQRFAANRRVVDASLGLIVHSEYVRSLLASVQTLPAPASRSTTPIEVIPQHVVPSDSRVEPAELRRALGLDEPALLFASFGLVTPEKRIEAALRAFSRVRGRFPRSRYLVVGDVASGCRARETAEELGLGDAVAFLGYVPKHELLSYIDASDICVSLRWPTAGETSASVLRLMSAGKPTIVSNVGSFAELPDDCCLKVPVGEAEEPALVSCMLALAEDPVYRRRVGERARLYTREHHTVEQAAARYLSFIERLVA